MADENVEKKKETEGKAGEQASKKAKRPTPLKRHIQDTARRLNNRSGRAEVKTAINKLKELRKQNADDATKKTALNQVYSLLDKGVKKGFYKKNAAARLKSRATV